MRHSAGPRSRRPVRRPAALRGTAALVARLALAVFAVVYLAFEILVGVSVGLLVDEAGVAIHVSPVGTIGLALFTVAVLLVVREPGPVPAEEEPLVAA